MKNSLLFPPLTPLTFFEVKLMVLQEGLMTPCSSYLPVRFASLMCASYNQGTWGRRHSVRPQQQ